MDTPDQLTWMPAVEIRQLIVDREISPVEVTRHFLDRIDEHDPTLHAFATLDPAGAQVQAKEAERAVLAGDDLGALHGIPISVKEHIAVAGIPRWPFGPEPAPRDDLGVERLRRAGAIIFGTNTMMGTGGELGRYQWELEARNPWDPSRVPGWSSAGGAAAAAARLVPIAIGSDGGGSTRLPAAYSGIVGVHPSRGRVPYVDYDFPGHMLTTTIGPLCRDVRDAAVVTRVMAGPDGRDLVSLPDEPEDYEALLPTGVDGMRFAWTDDYGYASMYALEESERVIDAVRDAALGFEKLSATVTPTNEVWEDFWEPYVVTCQVYREGPMGMTTEKPTAAAHQAALEARARNHDRFRAVLADHVLLLSVTSQLVARPVEEWDANWTTGGAAFAHGTFAPTYTSHTHMFNWLGWPALSVPCGFVDGLPVGLQIVGKPGSESEIFRAAAAFQDSYPQLEHPTVS